MQLVEAQAQVSAQASVLGLELVWEWGLALVSGKEHKQQAN